MTFSVDESLIDRIHEASFIPERWLPLLEELMAIAGCSQVALLQYQQLGIGRFVANEPARATFEVYYKEGWASRDVVSARAIQQRAFHFTTTWDLFTAEEFEQTEFYQQLALRCGIGSCCGALIPLPDNELTGILMHRPWREGPVDASAVATLNALRPHLARAALTAARLALEQARAALDTLTRLRLPACALNGDGRLRLGNALFEALVPEVVKDRAQRLVFSAPEADRLFAETLERERKLTSGRTGLTFPVRSTDGQPPYAAHLVPICGDGRDVFASAQWLLIAVPVAPSGQVNFSLIESLFDFTAAETAVAGGLLAGKTVAQIAVDRQASVQTVRSQLKAVMGKTGTNRQADLVRLLSNTQVFGGKGEPFG